MSEEKLYAVRNEEGKYIDFEYEKFLPLSESYCPAIVSEDNAKDIARDYGGHVVTLIEEPEKVVLTKEQAEIIEGAHDATWPATYISGSTGDSDGEDSLLMNAFVNGYTVKKDKKYNVKVPKKWSGDDKHYWTKEQDGTLTWAHLINNDYMTPYQQFTLTEIEHYGLQDCEKEEVSDDGE